MLAVIKRMKIVFLSSMLFFTALVSNYALAEEPVSKNFVANSAIGQHDTTAYHLTKAAAKGEKRFAHEWKGAHWYFSTIEQRDLFAANPDKYSPAYNGFCSNALTLDEGLIRTNGKVWHIFGDQLHFFMLKEAGYVG